MTKEYKNPETIGLHAGWRKDETTNSVAVPIHQTSSYQFDNTDHAGMICIIKLITRGLMNGNSY